MSKSIPIIFKIATGSSLLDNFIGVVHLHPLLSYQVLDENAPGHTDQIPIRPEDKAVTYPRYPIEGMGACTTLPQDPGFST